ncbi:MAG: efflux transporter outer membrane subunit [Sodaliphilus sp.]
MNYRQIIILFSAILLLNGCGIHRDYQRPESLPTDSLYRDAEAWMRDTCTLADISWRELFTDRQLVKWIEAGLEQNSDLQVARLRTEEAQATLEASRKALLPSFSVSAEGGISSYDASETSKSFSIIGSSEWEIDAFGGLSNEKKSKYAAWAASKAYEQAVQTQLIATIAETYYALIACDQKLEITRETAQQWSEQVRTFKALKRFGEQNEAAVAQAEAQRLETESAVVNLEKQIHELENSLSTLVGKAPKEVERGHSLELRLETELSVGLPAQLLSRRPDVKQAEWELAQAFYATNVARSAFYPKITLSGSAGWTTGSGASITNPGNWLMNVVGSVVQPIFNRGKNKANLKIAEAQQKEAQIAFAQKLLDAGAEVNNALTAWQTARKNVEINEQRVASLQTALRSTQLLMKHGSTNYLEVLTARQTLLQAQLEGVTDKYDEIESVIHLYHTLGGGAD